MLFPLVVFGVLALWPWAERTLTGDDALPQPARAARATTRGARRSARRSSTWVFLVFLAGSADRVDVWLGLDYVAQIWVYRVAVWVRARSSSFFVTRRVCRELLPRRAAALVRMRLTASCLGYA